MALQLFSKRAQRCLFSLKDVFERFARNFGGLCFIFYEINNANH